MAGMFDEREKGFEAKWVHDEEIRFRVLAKRNALLGLWAADELGLSGIKANIYAETLVQIGLTDKGSNPVFEKIRGDFRMMKIERSDEDIYKKMAQLLEAAANEVAAKTSVKP